MLAQLIAVAEKCVSPYSARMESTSDIRRRKLQALIDSRGLTPTALAKAAGMSEGTFRAFFSGKTKDLTLAKYEAVATALGMDVEDLVDLRGTLIPLVGRVGAGVEFFPVDDASKGGGLDEIPAPSGCPRDAVAVEIEGMSMFPDYWPGDILVYRRAMSFDRDACMYRVCIVKVIDGPTLVKRIRPGSRENLITLESTNAPLRPDEKIEWAAPVLFHDMSRRKPLTE